MAAAFPSNSSGFVPSHEASGGLIIGYSRNPTKFAVNRYVKIVPVKKDIGYYLNITSDRGARIQNTTQWRDGHEAPAFNIAESFEYLPYMTQRYLTGFLLGQKSIAQADWGILNVNAGFAAQEAMTHRTQIAATDLTTSGNWGAQTGAATSLGGGKWDVSSETDLFIKKTFDTVLLAITKATRAVIELKDIHCILNPVDAAAMSRTQEIRAFLKQSPFALAQVRQDVENQNGKWGLPTQLYSVELEIEDAVKVTSRIGAAAMADSFVWPARSAVFASRPGGIEGMEGIPDFSTYQFFMYEDMTVETKDDVDNRRTVGRVVNDFQGKVAAPASGYLVTEATSS